MAKSIKVDEADLRKTFASYDKDNSGCIDIKELKAAVKESLAGQKCTDKDIDAVAESVMKEVDTNGDGKICFEEFKKGFC